jgi:hypothetical protein
LALHRVARRTWTGQIRLGPALLLAALLPMFLYAGHWSRFLNEALGRRVHDADEVAEHANHCHLGVANCSEQPVPASVRVIPAVVDAPEPDLSLTPLRGSSVLINEHILAIPTEPPRV